MRLPILALTSALAVTAAVAPDALAQGKKKPVAPACGLNFLPMVEGRVWTYQFSAGDSPSSTSEARPVLKVDIPQKFTVKVVKVESKGASAEITLEESYRKLTQTTKISCSREAVNVDPNSFFASGEPGGAIGMVIENFKRGENPTYQRKGGALNTGEWREDLTFDVTRPPSQGTDVAHAPAKVEVERLVRVGGAEATSSGLGDHPKATKVEIQLTGRAYVVDKEKSVNMAAGIATLYFAPDVGLVRAINGFGHAWVLSSLSTNGDTAAAAPAPAGAAKPAAPAAPAAAPAAAPTPAPAAPPASSEPQVTPMKPE